MSIEPFTIATAHGPIELRDRHVVGATTTCRLSRMEHAVLLLLLKHRGAVVTADRMHRQLYGADGPEWSGAGVFVCRLRSKLAAVGAPKFVLTVRGEGHMILPAETRAEPIRDAA